MKQTGSKILQIIKESIKNNSNKLKLMSNQI